MVIKSYLYDVVPVCFIQMFPVKALPPLNAPSTAFTVGAVVKAVAQPAVASVPAYVLKKTLPAPAVAAVGVASHQ